MKKALIAIVVLLVAVLIAQRYVKIPDSVSKQLTSLQQSLSKPTPSGPFKITESKTTTLQNDEELVVNVIQKSLPSVVTIGIRATTTSPDRIQLDPAFGFRRVPGGENTIERDIGSGFIVSADGIVITNRHVVDNTTATYQVLTNDGKEYNVEKIYRDPLNDLAILKINANNLTPLIIGNSDALKLGQTAIAIGTPLGEFRNTVTRGIISGLGRGITAGSPYEGYVEKLDGVIQTDAAISAGNSGGPLLNSAGEVIGVNTAVSSQGQNIGFAIPSSVVKSLIESFNKRGGSFERPYIGVRYKIIDRQTAVLNDLVEGAYVVEVIADSPAEKAGLQEEDIILEIDGKKVQGVDDQALTKILLEKNVGDVMQLKIWREGQTQDIEVTLAQQ